MKTKSLKKILITVATVVALCILASFVLVGCGNKNEPAKAFNDYITLESSTTYATTTAKANTADLKTEGFYKQLTFKVTQGFKMSSFSFKASAQKTGTEKLKLGFALQNTSHEATMKVVNFYDFTKGGEQYFNIQETLGDAVLNPMCPEGTTITILIGLNNNNGLTESAFTKYANAISLYDFAIA